MLARISASSFVQMASRPQSVLPVGSTLFLAPSARKFVTSIARGSRSGIKNKTFSEQFTWQGSEAAGQTLRERLLGPTTGKPFIYGMYAVAGASAAGLGMLCYYGLGMSKELSALDRSSMWPEYVRERLKHTYSYLAGGLAITAASGIMAARSPQILSMANRNTALAFFGTLALLIGSGELTRAIPYDNLFVKHLAWASHCAIMGGLVLAPLCVLGGPILMRAAWYTAGIVGGLSATAICAPSEKFLNMTGPLAMGLGVVFVSSIGTFFLPPGTALGGGLASIAMYGGLILFSAYILHDTQRVIKIAEITPTAESQINFNRYANDFKYKSGGFDPINAQMSIYLSVLNIFIRLAWIIGGANGKKK